MFTLLSRKGNMLLHLGVLLLGMCVLVASAPLKEVQAAEVQTLAAMDLQPELPAMITEHKELEGKDLWEIVKPDVSGLAITVVCDITPAEEIEETEENEMLLADVAALDLEEDLIVMAMGLEGEMEILGDEPTVIITPEEPTAPEKATLAEEAAQEEEAAPAVSQNNGPVLTWKNPIELSKEEYNALLRIVEAESGCEDIVGRILVANVILNRVASSTFPNTVQKVVTQTHYGSLGLTYQFTPAKPGGTYYTAVPSADTIKAVDRALAGEDYSCGAMYFAARSYANSKHMSWFDKNLTRLFEHGGHEFYK